MPNEELETQSAFDPDDTSLGADLLEDIYGGDCDDTSLGMLYEHPRPKADVKEGSVVAPHDIPVEGREHAVHDIRVHIDRALKPQWKTDEHVRAIHFNGNRYDYGRSSCNTGILFQDGSLLGRPNMAYTLSEVKEAIAPYVEQGWFVTVAQQTSSVDFGCIPNHKVCSYNATDSWLRGRGETDHETGALALTFFRHPPDHVPTKGLTVRVLHTVLGGCILAALGVIAAAFAIGPAILPMLILLGFIPAFFTIEGGQSRFTLPIFRSKNKNLIAERPITGWSSDSAAFKSGLEDHHLKKPKRRSNRTNR